MSALSSNSVIRKPFYFGEKTSPLFGWLHKPIHDDPAKQCILMCSPLGLEYMNSYRSLRHLADNLARMGITVLRFDYHGTGDSSGSNYNEDKLTIWLDNIATARQALLSITNLNESGLIGFRMGASLGLMASETVPFNFLVLWAPILSGKRFVREIKTLQKMSAVSDRNSNPILEAGGMVFWPKTEERLQSFNLLETKPVTNKILIVPQDDQTVDKRLATYFDSIGVLTKQIALKGSADMLVDAHLTTVPFDSISKIVQWCRSVAEFGSTSASRSTLESKTTISNKTGELTQSTSFIVEKQDPEIALLQNYDATESVFKFGDQANLFAIKTERTSGYDPKLPIIIFANSGTNHHIGPSRLYVQLARRLAALGFLVVRLDLSGIGDSIVENPIQENIEYIDTGASEILQAMDSLNDSLKPNKPKFIISGLCSGAYFSFQTALAINSRDVEEIYLINPLTFYWEQGMTADSSLAKNFSAWNWYKQAVVNPSSWRKIFSGKANYTYLFNTLRSRMLLKMSLFVKKKSKSNKATTEHGQLNTTVSGNLGYDMESIITKDIRVSFLFASSDPGYDLLMTLGGKTVKKYVEENKISIEFIENADHTFSKFGPRKEAIIKIVEHFKGSRI